MDLFTAGGALLLCFSTLGPPPLHLLFVRLCVDSCWILFCFCFYSVWLIFWSFDLSWMECVHLLIDADGKQCNDSVMLDLNEKALKSVIPCKLVCAGCDVQRDSFFFFFLLLWHVWLIAKITCWCLNWPISNLLADFNPAWVSPWLGLGTELWIWLSDICCCRSYHQPEFYLQV